MGLEESDGAAGVDSCGPREGVTPTVCCRNGSGMTRSEMVIGTASRAADGSKEGGDGILPTTAGDGDGVVSATSIEGPTRFNSDAHKAVREEDGGLVFIAPVPTAVVRVAALPGLVLSGLLLQLIL